MRLPIKQAKRLQTISKLSCELLDSFKNGNRLEVKEVLLGMRKSDILAVLSRMIELSPGWNIKRELIQYFVETI